jgi:hypothetical protein
MTKVSETHVMERVVLPEDGITIREEVEEVPSQDQENDEDGGSGR